jgi:hypothetical protein
MKDCRSPHVLRHARVRDAAAFGNISAAVADKATRMKADKGETNGRQRQ